MYNVFLQMATAGQVDRINLDDTLSLSLPGVDMGQESSRGSTFSRSDFCPTLSWLAPFSCLLSRTLADRHTRT